MTSENSQTMDFDEENNECPEVLQDNEHDMEHDSEYGTASSRKLKTYVNENETENFATGVRPEFSIDVDSQEPDQPLQGSAIQNDSDDDTEEYPLDDENSGSVKMGKTASKKSKTSHRDRGKMKQTSMKDFLSRDSSPDEPKPPRSSKHSSPAELKAARPPRDSSPDELKAARPPRMKKRWSDLDTEAYRNGYPGKKDDAKAKDNLKFYTNKLKSKPDGDFIDNIHENWKGNYKLLETHHGYIQWLFPIREPGMNYQAQELQLHEAEAIKKNKQAQERVLKSYELMLDFYGMRLKNRETGEIERAENWKQRFAHLNRSIPMHMQITRILKSLGELGFDHFQYPFVEFVLREALAEKTLKECSDSCSNYWIGTVKNDVEREKLEEFFNENAKESHASGCTV